MLTEFTFAINKSLDCAVTLSLATLGIELLRHGATVGGLGSDFTTYATLTTLGAMLCRSTELGSGPTGQW